MYLAKKKLGKKIKEVELSYNMQCHRHLVNRDFKHKLKNKNFKRIINNGKKDKKVI